ISEDIIGEANARTPVVGVMGKVLCRKDAWIGQKDFWHHLVFETDTQVQGQAGQNAPAVFHEEGNVIGIELEAERTKGLLVGRIAGSGVCGAALARRKQVRKIVSDGGVIEGAELKAEVLGGVVRVSNVHPELPAVLAANVRERIGELCAAFIRESGPL